MKLLLTSRGITNKSIKDKFFELVGKKPEDIHVAYIPTAINISSQDDKRWAIDSLRSLDDMKIGIIDIVDVAATPIENWLPKLERADVLYVEGGRPSYLKEEFEKYGLAEMLKNEFADKVYVGCSAGSMILGKVIVKSSSEAPGYKDEKGFGFFDFAIRPHFYRDDRSKFNEEMVASLAKKFDVDFYAIDDDTAIAVQDGKVEVVSEGKWKKFDK